MSSSACHINLFVLRRQHAPAVRWFWLWLYRKPAEHPKVSREELALIQSDPPDAKRGNVSWSRLFPLRETWAFAAAKFFTDPVWWFYLFWLPRYVAERFHLTLAKTSAPILAVYGASCIGSIGGGWLSSSLIQRHWTINASRKVAMLVCAVAVVPIVFASMTASLWTAVALIGLAAAAHQGWSANLFTLASDMFPRSAVGSVVGIGGMAGAVGGMLIAKIVGYVLEWTGSYLPVFIIAGSMYLIALLFIHLIVPRMEPASC